MLTNIIVFLIMILLGIAGMTFIQAAQYLYKEKHIKSGLRQALYNSSVSGYPENKQGKWLLLIGQICIGLDILIFLVICFF